MCLAIVAIDQSTNTTSTAQQLPLDRFPNAVRHFLCRTIFTLLTSKKPCHVPVRCFSHLLFVTDCHLLRTRKIVLESWNFKKFLAGLEEYPHASEPQDNGVVFSSTVDKAEDYQTLPKIERLQNHGLIDKIRAEFDNLQPYQPCCSSWIGVTQQTKTKNNIDVCKNCKTIRCFHAEQTWRLLKRVPLCFKFL